MIERREKTTTEGRGLGFSFAADNVERGDPDVDFIKRRPTYPIGDNPRGREINFGAGVNDTESYSGRSVYRAYKGRFPLEGQDPHDPKRIASLQKASNLRPALPNLSVDTEALEAIKVQQRAQLASSDYAALFPTTTIASPAPSASFTAGTRITIVANASSLMNIQRGVLIVNGAPVDSRILDRRDQSATTAEWIFLYDIPTNQPIGTMDITVRTFSIENAVRGFIADDAINEPPLDEPRIGALGTLDGRPGSKTSSDAYQLQLAETQYLRTPGGATTISINIT